MNSVENPMPLIRAIKPSPSKKDTGSAKILNCTELGDLGEKVSAIAKTNDKVPIINR